MTETERIRRVREMERRMHELSAAAEGLQTALAAYEAALPARRALEDYYESPLWASRRSSSRPWRCRCRRR